MRSKQQPTTEDDIEAMLAIEAETAALDQSKRQAKWTELQLTGSRDARYNFTRLGRGRDGPNVVLTLAVSADWLVEQLAACGIELPAEDLRDVPREHHTGLRYTLRRVGELWAAAKIVGLSDDGIVKALRKSL